MPTKARPQLKAAKRTITGRKVKQLRRQGILPANVFGKKINSQSLQIQLQDFTKIFDQVGETGLVDLNIKSDKNPRPVLISNIQIDPVTNQPLHVDFHQVDLKEKVTAAVPVEIIGEAPAVKEKGAVLITLLNEIEVEALPADLPEKFEVDISSLKEFNDSILAKDLKIDRSKITLQVEDDAQIVMVQEHKEEEITPTAEEAKTETEEAVETKAAEEDKEEKPAEEKTAEKKPQETQETETKEQPQKEEAKKEKKA